MKISVRNNYTKHQLSVEKEILKALRTNNSGLLDGFSLREIKETADNNNPRLNMSKTIIREIIEDLVVSGEAVIVNPDNQSWRLYRIVDDVVAKQAHG